MDSCVSTNEHSVVYRQITTLGQLVSLPVGWSVQRLLRLVGRLFLSCIQFQLNLRSPAHSSMAAEVITQRYVVVFCGVVWHSAARRLRGRKRLKWYSICRLFMCVSVCVRLSADKNREHDTDGGSGGGGWFTTNSRSESGKEFKLYILWISLST